MLPLEHASKDVKKSALFSDMMADIKHLIKTLNDFNDNRESNIQSLSKTKSIITKQILAVKSQFLKQINVLEQALYAELSTLNHKHEIEIKISLVLSSLNMLKASENEANFLKDHGSDNKLLTSLHQKVTNIQKAEACVLQMKSNLKEIKITFDKKKDIKLEYYGTVSESFSSCQVKKKNQTKFNSPRSWNNKNKHIAGFEKETELQLKTV